MKSKFVFSLCLSLSYSSLISQFVLKHREFFQLREAAYCLGTLNPHREHSVNLVLQIVRQVLELHPDIRFLHIGADEVWQSDTEVVTEGLLPFSLQSQALLDQFIVI